MAMRLHGIGGSFVGATVLALAAGASSATGASAWSAAPPTSPDLRAVATGLPALDAAIRDACARETNPSAYLSRALGALRASPMCFPDTMTREEWDLVLRRWGMRPPSLLNNNMVDFWIDTTQAWQGTSAQGPAGRAQRASLTYSFPNDGVIWGLSDISSTGPNDLNAKLEGLFGVGNLDQGREYFRQCLGAWRKYCGLTYSEVADLNVAENQVLTSPGNGGGDVRIGGLGFGTSGTFLAYDAFPSANFAGVGGADMTMNTSYFRPTTVPPTPTFYTPDNDFRYIRNTVAHEHGHGTGNIHSVPCDQTKLMEPSIGAASHDMHGIDDKRGGGRNYGDRFSGNQSAATAKYLGDLASPAPHSVIEPDLSTNGTTGFGNTDEDWFHFLLATDQPVVISVDPTGGNYTAGQQSSSCTGTTAAINAEIAGNLNIELRNADGTVVLQTAATAAAGAIETLNAGTLAAGDYTIRVFDVGPNVTANQRVQLYDFTVRVGASFAPPQAIAGVHKRIAANTNCFFMGDVSSRATEAGATISAYAWDLDADGSFETPGGKANRQYVSNGVYPVGLMVTDSNGSVGFDTINVTVFGAVTTIADVLPDTGGVGQTVGVTITGTNLRNVTSASMVAVSGSGVAVSGTPIPDALGTTVTGLSFVIDPMAAPGARDVSVSNPDGSATLVGAFQVEDAGPCPGDANGDNLVNFADLNIVLSNFGQTGPSVPGDVNHDGQVNFSDLNIVLSFFGVTC